MTEPRFVVKPGGLIRRRPAIKDWPRTTLAEARGLIGNLRYSDVWKQPGTIAKAEEIRLDAQKPIVKDAANLQIQINDEKRSARAGTTIAGVIVYGQLRDFGATHQQPQRDQIVAAVKEALTLSLERGVNVTVERAP